MPEQRDCKEYSSKYVTASELLAKHALELARILPLAGGNIGDLRVYDGVDTNGELKLRLKVPTNNTKPFSFNPHIYFRSGLYLEFASQIDGCFAQWRLRPHGED